MYTGNVLDRLLQRFQHRWETDRQWRAAMGGVLALLSILMLCACVGLTGNMLNRVLGPAGLGLVDLGQPAGNDGPPDTGARLVNGVLTFPTPTAVWTVGAVPALSPIPNSQTPIPTPTSPPTPTPTPTPTPGPGCTVDCGGPPPTGVTITVTGWTPSKWVNGRSATISVHTSVPNDNYGFIINWPAGGSTVLPPDSIPPTDGSGNGTTPPFTVPAGGCISGRSADVKVQYNNNGSLAYLSPDPQIPCA